MYYTYRPIYLTVSYVTGVNSLISHRANGTPNRKRRWNAFVFQVDFSRKSTWAGRKQEKSAVSSFIEHEHQFGREGMATNVPLMAGDQFLEMGFIVRGHALMPAPQALTGK